LAAPSKKLRETSEDSLKMREFLINARSDTLHFGAKGIFFSTLVHIVISNSAPYNEQNYQHALHLKLRRILVAVSCCLKYGRNMENLFTRLLQVLQLLNISQFTSIPE
jgi:hypothetical protein